MKGVLIGKIDGNEVFEYTLKNKNGLITSIMNYGASVTKLYTHDRDGNLGDIIIGFDSLEGYLQKDNPYMNCIIGRVANRIANASYIQSGNRININSNNKDYVLHGGINGFDKKIWKVEHVEESVIILSYQSEDGEEGFPGNLFVEVTYRLTDENELHIEYSAQSDAVTPVNLTSHCYFNLSAGKDKDILSHNLRVKADYITEVDGNSIPTGMLSEVSGTLFDLNEKVNLGKVFKEIDGFDHNWVLGDKLDKPKFVATLYHEGSGRIMEVYTTEPGVQVYTSNGFDGKLKHTKGKAVYGKYAGICLETQLFPDSPNHPQFPSPFVDEEHPYHQVTIYKMRVG